jgi:pilus assembly protein CpaC
VRAKAAILNLLCSLLLAGFGWQQQLGAQTGPAATVTPGDEANELAVTVGKTVLVDTARPIARVAVGLGEVAQATVISPTEIMLAGKSAGETSLILWDRQGGRQFFTVRVRAAAGAAEAILDAVRRELHTELPTQALKVSEETGVVYLRGTVKDLTSSARAVQIASMAGKVVNLLNVEVPAADPQILLKVRFCSVDRSKATQLGINLFSLGLGNTLGGISTGQFSPPSIASSSSSSGASGSTGSATISQDLNFLAYFPGLNGGASIQALQTTGVMQILAEPNLLATNGKQASFLAGGEYPYPVVQGGSGGSGSSVSIEFKEYGVRLNFLPTITPRGTIRLQVAPEVSSLDFTNAVEVSGFDVPAITTRKVRTEVELSAGESFVIGGLLDNRETQTFEKLPFLGDIPVLGKFFQSISKSRTNTELIVVVTPELVTPIAPGAPVPALNYPEKFLPTNTAGAMHTPVTSTAAASAAIPTARAVIPVEKLIDSMKPETPLVIEGARGGFGTASSTTTTSATAAQSTAPAQ